MSTRATVDLVPWAVVVAYLDVQNALRALLGSSSICNMLKSLCLNCKSASLWYASTSLWSASIMPEIPYARLLERNVELSHCIRTVREDERFVFHVHYITEFIGCRNIKHDSRLDSLGSLKYWRPGDPPRPREGDPANGIPAMPENYTPDFEVHLLPPENDDAVSSDRMRAACDASPDGFVDIDYGLGIWRLRSPREMLLKSGAAEPFDGMLQPMLVWMLCADYQLILQGDTRILLGCVDAYSGDFVLASARHEQLGISVEGDWSYVGFAVARKRQWSDMMVLLEDCWEYAGKSMVPSCFPETEGDMPQSEHHAALSKFQDMFHRLAVAAVGAKRTGSGDVGSGRWLLAEGDAGFWGDESESWVTEGDFSIRMWESDVDKITYKASIDARLLFHQAIDDAAYHILRGAPDDSSESESTPGEGLAISESESSEDS